MPTVTTYPGVFGPYSPITFTRNSTGTYFDSTGTLQTALDNVPRLDYDPSTLAAQGVLIEEQRSNIVYPSNFSSIGTVAVNNAWYEVNATLDTTVNAGVAPDGTTTAALLAVNAPTTFNAAQYRTTSTTAATYAFSCFCKANSTDTLVRLQVSGDTGFVNLVRADFTLTGVGAPGAASAVGTATAPSAPTIQPVGNGWYRCTIIVALTAPTNITCAVYPGTTGAQTTASQTLVWGAQLEAGAFPTSYIPTTTMALTRNADQASVNTLSPWYNQVSGTMFAEFSSFGTPATFPTVWQLDDGTAQNNLIGYVFTNVLGVAQRTLNVSQGDLNTAGAAINAANTTKMGYAYATNDSALSGNGSALTGTAIDNTVSIPTVTTLRLGAKVTPVNVLNGYLRRITYYPRRLSNAELQALTV